ncbi:MAG: DUF1638 domain-containing protein [Methanosarcinaceae archaeon]|nr:DUF1638 domain-containing protein [Methanosarcinaceae archaeon]
MGYKNVARLDIGICYEKDFDPVVEEFARLLGFCVIEMKTSTDLISRCYGDLCGEVRG